MNGLSITLGFFTSTKGHFGRKTDWKLTLNHWDKQVPLSLFNRVAHLKVSPDEQELGDQMTSELVDRGFHVLKTIGSWNRGLSHGEAYLWDMVRLSKLPQIYEKPYFMLVEDDSIVVSSQSKIEDLLLQSCKMLDNDHQMLTMRFMRPGDKRVAVIEYAEPDPRYFWSGDTNFQPLIMRGLDFYRLGLQLERNSHRCRETQCELLWRQILDEFSDSPYRHAVWEPEFANTPHLGVPDPEHSELVKVHELSL